MISVEQFNALEVGSTFEVGTPMVNVSKEKLVWKVEKVTDKQGAHVTIYYFDIPVCSKVLTLNTKKNKVLVRDV